MAVHPGAEEVCDDHVMALGLDRAAYAHSLVDVAERLQPHWSGTAAALGMVTLRSALGRRVERILDTRRVLSVRAGSRSVVTMVLLAAGSTLGAGWMGADAAPTPVGEFKITGAVSGPDGRPLAGATVVGQLVRWRDFD